jgi:hypothetical protein
LAIDLHDAGFCRPLALIFPEFIALAEQWVYNGAATDPTLENARATDWSSQPKITISCVWGLVLANLPQYSPLGSAVPSTPQEHGQPEKDERLGGMLNATQYSGTPLLPTVWRPLQRTEVKTRLGPALQHMYGTEIPSI